MSVDLNLFVIVNVCILFCPASQPAIYFMCNEKKNKNQSCFSSRHFWFAFWQNMTKLSQNRRAAFTHHPHIMDTITAYGFNLQQWPIVATAFNFNFILFCFINWHYFSNILLPNWFNFNLPFLAYDYQQIPKTWYPTNFKHNWNIFLSSHWFT